MKLSRYTQTFSTAVAENKHGRWVMLALVVSNVLLALCLIFRNQVVVMVPPDLPGRSEVAENDASSGVKEVWGTYVATLLGNVTPRSAGSVAKVFGQIVGPSAYKDLLDAVNKQTKVIEDEQVSVQFSPTQVFWLPERDVVVVSGELVLRGLRDNERRFVRTYEVGVDIRHYMVSVRSLRVYDGPWSPDGNKTDANAQHTSDADTTGEKG